jgi:hypothetical protein
MSKKRTATTCLVDEQVWNTNSLTDNKRQTLDKGTVTAPRFSSSSPVYAMYFICHWPITYLVGFTARAEDIQDVVSILQNKSHVGPPLLPQGAEDQGRRHLDGASNSNIPGNGKKARVKRIKEGKK